MRLSKRRWVFSSSRLATIASNGPQAFRTASHALFSLVFPDDCRICARALEEVTRVPVCASCLSEPQPISAEFFCVSCRTPFLNRFPLDAEGRCALCRSGLRGFDAAYCFGSYEGALRELIHLYKYSRVRPLAGRLGELLSTALPRDRSFDAIVPVPLHWRRQWERGFNQSELLARELARRCGVPVVRALRRIRPTLTQAGLSHTRRRENVRAAFVARGAARRLVAKNVLLIDDVMTTGSTATASALALKRSGIKRVELLTIARVDRRMDGWRAQGGHGG